ncbi:MAG: hypothetical protein A3K19_26755 [Lentisphaerae bacterium RIFOXYB12_FULL_65_16]|nr:MAG: hypothetical protein A3K18_03405 [Lentisphaerae bacterium RIFOXYA12_64_32]OGV84321.1 MAG: hypothetical protein A3K19_26755 [Lentisphaerae bacterium RIFOXYB12_FULL_65_16]
MNRYRILEALRLLLRVDPILVALMMLLVGTGILFIYGAGQETGGRLAGYWVRQLCWAGAGVLCFVILTVCDYQVLGRWSWLFYAACAALLVVVKMVGVTTYHSQSWLEVPFLPGVRVQPAEFAKPVLLLFIAWIASRPMWRTSRTWFAVPVLAAAGLPILLIALQPDWGTALVFMPFTLVVIFVAGIRWRWVLLGVLAVALVAPLGYTRLKPHQKERIQTFLHMSRDISDQGWNAHQSMLAVGSGGMWGKGYMQGTQHVLGFLPRTVAPTDFIFSVIAEETGFVGSAAVVCAFIGLILCCLRTAMVAPDALGSYLAVGVATILFTHAYINIGMTMQAAPIIGIPLPFVSYGGSFMLGTMAAMGLVQSVHVRRGLIPPE